MSDGAFQWNTLGRELRFANAAGTVNYVNVNWDDLLWPNSSAWGITTNLPVLGDINHSILTINASPDKSGGGVWTWYCGQSAPPANEMDLWSVASHEWGHCVELHHSQQSADTMYQYLNVGTTFQRSLTTHDKAGIQAMYPPA